MVTNMRLKRLLPELWILVGLHISLLDAQEMFPIGNFETLRRKNCTNCQDRIPTNGAHLPRLTLIKQRILQALGREDKNEQQRKHIAPTYLPKAFIAPKQKTTPSPKQMMDEEEHESSGLNEIVIFSERIGYEDMHGSLDEFEFRSDPTTDYGVSCPCTSKKSTSPLFRSPEPKAYGTENGNAVINFKYHSHQSSTDITPVGASLLLHIHRRRKIRKGGKGKKIILSVTDHDEQSTSKDILTYLRTRVKKSRWKKLSLPLSVAQKFLNSGERGLSLRVNCAGCGRLVQLVFSNLNTPQKSQKRKRKRKKEAASENQRKRRKPRRNRERRNISTRPILVISTRQNHDL